MLRSVRPVEFCGGSRADLRHFPPEVRREAGLQLFQVQQGLDPDDWKPMDTVGSGVREIRIRERSGAYRLIYVAKFADAVFVLHCFQKKTRKTASDDLALARWRFKELVRELNR
ncbi:MAG: type II toxin-antitoxin system RelE/ParE family toxin [Terracidiphilus sp.]